ncbi:hypothetical protein BIW11_09661 [Tropilaelaps mercedesae]|uniref:Uncharacterized protein n=1 Tax=Tropilaelaps mercedesae TaxID=418985 RepID=A0A1V9XJ24_9ACAR|nr:hypothetical protein BIW11_09661 [Tropilaelaps mercedesae]
MDDTYPESSMSFNTGSDEATGVPSKSGSSKKLCILIGVSMVALVAIVAFFLTRKSGLSERSLPPVRPTAPPNHKSVCTIKEREDVEGIMTMLHNVSVLIIESRKKGVVNMNYEYLAKIAVPLDLIDEGENLRYLVIVFATLPKAAAIIYRFFNCGTKNPQPILLHEYANSPVIERIYFDNVIPTAKQIGTFICQTEPVVIDGVNFDSAKITVLVEIDFATKKLTVKNCEATADTCVLVYTAYDKEMSPDRYDDMEVNFMSSWPSSLIKSDPDIKRYHGKQDLRGHAEEVTVETEYPELYLDGPPILVSHSFECIGTYEGFGEYLEQKII